MPIESRPTDPRDLFISANPNGLSDEDLIKEITGFADPRTHADYLVFLAGYEAGQPGEQLKASKHLLVTHPAGTEWAVMEGDKHHQRALLADHLTIAQLYTGAEQEGVSQLRADLETVRSERDAFGQNAIDLQARLNKQDALLREFLEIATAGFADAEHVLRVRRDLQAALSSIA